MRSLLAPDPEACLRVIWT